MTNLYHCTSKHFSKYCFANSNEEATQYIIENCSDYRNTYSLTVELIEDETLQEDGVNFLRENNFVGIPQIKIFMLNGSQFHKMEYFARNNSARFWWSEKVPGSENIRAKQTVYINHASKKS